MHVGAQDVDYQYMMNETALEKTVKEKDLGVYVTPDLKSTSHIAIVAARANSVLGQIKNAFTYMDKEMFLALYLTMVRPIMEYAVQAWAPKFIKDSLTVVTDLSEEELRGSVTRPTTVHAQVQV